jgi:hypothetical protein
MFGKPMLDVRPAREIAPFTKLQPAPSTLGLLMTESDVVFLET